MRGTLCRRRAIDDVMMDRDEKSSELRSIVSRAGGRLSGSRQAGLARDFDVTVDIPGGILFCAFFIALAFFRSSFLREYIFLQSTPRASRRVTVLVNDVWRGVVACSKEAGRNPTRTLTLIDAPPPPFEIILPHHDEKFEP